MSSRAELEQEAEAIIAFGDGRDRSDDELFDRMHAFVSSDPAAVFEIGESLAADTDPDRREVGLDIVGMAAQLNRPQLRDRALPILRQVLEADAAIGPLSSAVMELGHLDDEGAHDAVLALAHHADPIVRNAVAFAAPSVGFDDRAMVTLVELSADDDEDVRDWATFALGELTDMDNEALREALYARLNDPHYETRVEAIVGLARRQDERVRPHLLRELADPDHAETLNDAVQYLDQGTGRYFYEKAPAE